MSTVPIGGHCVGEGEPVFILAEVASAHQGEPDKALELARAARDAGASGVKLQLFRADELVAPNDPSYETFQKIELPLSEWERILDEAQGLGLELMADVFDRTSLSLGERHGVVAYKVHTTDMENPDFIRRVASTGKTVMLSTGGCRPSDIEEALGCVRSEGNENILLLHGVQNFPTRIEDAHLRSIATLKSNFGCPVGFLDHVDGAAPIAKVLPALAVACGASLIEKHITLDRAARGFDYQSSLEPEGFREMVGLLRQAEQALGGASLPRTSATEDYHRSMRRAVLSRVELHRGEPLEAHQLAFLRCGKGVAPKNAPRLIGRKPRRDVPAWQPLTEELLE